MEKEKIAVDAVVREASDLVQRLIMRYECDADADTANVCEWCKGGERCDSCRRMTDDDDQGIAFELDVSAITGGGPIVEA